MDDLDTFELAGTKSRSLAKRPRLFAATAEEQRPAGLGFTKKIGKALEIVLCVSSMITLRYRSISEFLFAGFFAGPSEELGERWKWTAEQSAALLAAQSRRHAVAIEWPAISPRTRYPFDWSDWGRRRRVLSIVDGTE
jgi:hypothetical protein